MSETALSKSIREALEASGLWVERINSGSPSRRMRGVKRGTPDLLIIGPGRYGWLEVKDPGENLRPSQVEWHEKAARLGVPVRVVRSVAEALEATKGMVRYE